MTVRVVLYWNDALGICYDCALPAAFAVPAAYGEDAERKFWADLENNPASVDAKHKRCAVCAANDAAGGETIVRLIPRD